MKREIKIFLTLLLIFWTLIQPPAGLVEARYLRLMKAVLHDGTFIIDNQVDTTQPVGDAAYKEGHYYLGSAPGPAFVGLPLYFLYSKIDPYIPESLLGEVPNRSDVFAVLFVTALTVCLFAALAGLLMYRILGFFIRNDQLRLALTFFFALGTQCFFYSVRLDAYMLSVFFGTACLYFVLKNIYENGGESSALAAGLCAGILPSMNYDTAMISGVLGLTLILATPRSRLRTFTAFAAGAVIPLAGLMLYHNACFENPFLPAYYYGQEPDVRSTTPMTLAFFTNPDNLPGWDRIWGLTLGKRGFFVYSPIMLLVPIGLGVWLFGAKRNQFEQRWRRLLIPVALLCALYALFQLTTPLWWGYSTWGPRYLLPGIPFFFLFAAVAARRVRVFWVYWLGGLSVFINWVGAQFGYADSLFYHIAQFLISGPATPLHRWLAKVVPAHVIPHHAETITPGAAMYYALTHLSALGVYLILGVLIWGIWRSDRWYCARGDHS